MGNTNYGNQKIGISFGEAATSLLVNFIEYGIVPKGMYKGGLLTTLSANQVSLSPLVCFINSDADLVGVRIETTAAITLTVTPSTPFIIARFSWANSTINFMDILAISSASLIAGDIIIGRCIYVGSTLQATFDYSQRLNGWLVLLGSKELELKVTPTDPVSNILNISAGVGATSGLLITSLGGNSPAIPNTTLGRNDVLYVENDGTFNIWQGVDSNTPVTPDYQAKVVLAEIHRGANRTNVRGDEIILIKDRRYSIDQNASIDSTYLNLGTGADQIQASIFGITNPTLSIQATNVEDALTELNEGITKSFTVDANELNTINPGDVVTIFNGNIRKYQETSVLGSTQLVFTATGTALNELSQDTLAPGVIICAFYNVASPNSAIKVAIITTNGKVATPNTVYEIENFTDNPYRGAIDKVSVKRISATQALLLYQGGNSGANTARAIVLTITGTVITWNPSDIISFNTGGADQINSEMIDSTHAIVIYRDGSVNKTTTLILTISGTTLTAGSKYQPDSTQRTLYRLKYLFKSATSGSHVLMVLWDDGAVLHTNQIIVTSLFAVSWTATDSVGASYITNKDEAWLFSQSKGLAHYIRDGAPTIPQEVNYTEGVFTNRISIVNSATNFIPRGISGLEQSPNTHIIFGADSANSNKGTIMLYRWKNGIPFTSVPQVIINSSISYYTRLSYIDESHILCIWMETASTLLKCAVLEILNNFDTIIGIALNTATAGQSCNVAIDGVLTLSGLSPNTNYMLNTNGGLTNNVFDSLITEPLRIIGRAISATQLQLCSRNFA